MSKRVTIKDIAKALNTNSSTVSRALNNSPLISEQTKLLVKQKAREMGYAPNSIAQQLRQGHSRTIGMLVPLINRVFFANVIHGVEALAQQNGYQLLICQSHNDGVKEAEALQMLRGQKVAGIIISSAGKDIDTQLYQQLINEGTSMVMFDRVIRELAVSKVINANREASYQAVKHLLEQGYRRIVHYGGPLSLNIYQERYEGYKQALEDAGLQVDPDLVFRPVLSQEAGRDITRRLLQDGSAFDAIAATSDLSGLGAWQVLQEAGISMPAEVGLIGFANETFTELIGMSSVEQFSVDMGRAAAELMLEEIRSKVPQNTRPQREVVIIPRLVARASSTRLVK